MDITSQLALEYRLQPKQAINIVTLIDQGNTLPFIARYRKELTGSLDDQLLRELYERLGSLRRLEQRRQDIATAISEQDKLSDDLAMKIAQATSLTELEDLYRPFRPKRHTRASIARKKGLEPLALHILTPQPPFQDLMLLAQRHISRENDITSAETALAGARDILAEWLSDDADLIGRLRESFRRHAVLESRQNKDGDSVYRLYYDFSEPIVRIPPHRILAINRGEREEWLKVKISTDAAAAISILQQRCPSAPRDCAEQFSLAAGDAWDRLIAPALERGLRSELTDRAGKAAIRIFGQNLRQLLMQPPVKGRITLGIDPGYRTGCKLAVVDTGGRVLHTGVGYFTPPAREVQKAQAKRELQAMITRYGVTAIAIGNGTASREAEAFVAELLKDLPDTVGYAIVNESGASVYSASPLAAEEFPHLDVSLRSAVSIARRLQDPLAELVKIDPRSIGVGQYQHDLKEAELASALDGVVEDCVHAVGVELSTASASLLSRVAGIGPVLSKNIIAYRDENGIASRAELKKVPRLGPKAFEQCAGFLRIRDSKNVLDATGVHPESYPATLMLLKRLGFHPDDIQSGAPDSFMDAFKKAGAEELSAALGVGLPTLYDIVGELHKPGRDPREDLPPITLRSAALDIEDLAVGTELEGTVRNVVDFGAFVDIGVHQDGLVHISRMSERYVNHPSEIVRVGDLIRVWVIEVDAEKKRIGLSLLPPEDAQNHVRYDSLMPDA